MPMPIERRRKPSAAGLRSEVSFERAEARMAAASGRRDGMGNPGALALPHKPPSDQVAR